MTTRSTLVFSIDRAEAVAHLESVANGRGWCNVSPVVLEDVPEHKVNALGLWVTHGVTVATLVTAAVRHDQVQPSTMGLLHSRGRLGRSRIDELVGEPPFLVKQDHAQRGLLLEVPAATPTQRILDVMCTLGTALCDFETTGSFNMVRFLND